MLDLLVDTGPLVAWFDRRDADHARVAAFFDAFEGRLLSTWPVLTEVCHLLPESLVPRFMEWVARGGLSVVELPASAAGVLAARMQKYADLPMDLADTSLLWLAEAEGLDEIATLDERDFGVYRTTRGTHLRNVLAPKPPRARRSKAVSSPR